MPVIEFEGKTTEEAIEQACNQLHLPTNELKFEIVSAGSSGIFGLGGKKARIRVSIEEKMSRKEESASPERKRHSTPKEEARIEKPEPRNRRPKPSGKTRDAQKSKAPKEPAAFEPEDPVIKSIPLPASMPGPGEEVHDGPEDTVMTQSRQALQDILERMFLEAEVKVCRIEDRIVLSVQGDNGGLLIGKKGATLDALQFLVNKIVNRNRSEKCRVVVDAENYRQRRQQSLVELAQRMAAKARRNKRPVTISQLSAHDRRVVHLALQDKPGLKTRSRGEGPMKNVIIIPDHPRETDKAERGKKKDKMIEPESLMVDETGNEGDLDVKE